MIFTEIFESVKLGLDAIKVNKLRSFLASLGVVIGISFVILMGWVLSGLDTALLNTFNMMGTDMVYIDKWDWAGGKSWKELRQRKNITLKQANQYFKRIENAELAFPSVRQWGAVLKYKNENYQGTQISGTTFEHSLTPAGQIIDGRHFSMFEDESGSKVIVLGFKVAETIFPDGDAVGKYIKINGHKFKVIGIIKKQGTILFDFVDNQSFIPFKAFTKIFGRNFHSIMISAKAGHIDGLDDLREESYGLMREIRNIKPGEEEDFSINETKTFDEIINNLRLYVGGVGIGFTILSFIVGIIGIMNIMFVSVTDRTREIGIRKAIGAKKRSIWTQFIVESATLCFIGALLAFVFCSIFIYLVATILPVSMPEINFLTSYIPIDLLIISSFVSIIVGVLAGLLPAIRAANLDPVDALRYE